MHRLYLYAIIFFVIVLLVLGALAEEKTYLWPTEASHLLTSTFGEYRPGRFHAGIDIKTWGQVGYPVVAIRPGYISQIELSPWGYGRLLYLRMDTGETALYAHLLKFGPEVEAYVRAAQLERNRYSVNLFFDADRFPVEQGEVLAFTGQSGIGAPHLHFEILDLAGRPTNPLLKGYKVADTVPPTIKRLALIPLMANARINGDLKPVVLLPRQVAADRFTIPQVLTVHGMVGFATEVHDKMDATWNGFGAYRQRLYIDELEIFSSQCDIFSYEQGRQAVLDRDFRFIKQGRGLYNRLFRDFGNDLMFYSGEQTWHGVVDFGADKNQGELLEYLAEFLGWSWSRPAGVIDLPVGERTFRVEVEDFFGNRTEVSGRLRAVPALIPEQDRPAAISEVNAAKILNINSDFYDHYIRLAIAAPAVEAQRLHLIAEGGDGSRESLPLNLVNGREWVAGLPLNESRPGPVALELTAESSKGETLVCRELLNYSIVLKGREKNLRTEDGLCQLEFNERSLFKTIYLRARTVEREADLTGIQMSKVYEFMPADVPLFKGVRVCIQWPHPFAENVALFGKNGGNGWKFIGDSLDSRTGCISGRTADLGSFCILRDDQPPVISSLIPAMGLHTQNRRPLLKAHFNDSLSGIGGEDNWSLYLDDIRVIAEYDPEAHSLFYQPAAPLARGAHRVRVQVRDRCGNETVQSHAFMVD